MEITDLSLRSYRNHVNADFHFTEGINVIEGANTVGKTNLVEAVYFCGFGKSPKNVKDKDLVTWGQSEAKISLAIQKKYRKGKIEALISSNGQKRIAIDNAGISRLAELVGFLNVVYFSPDEMKMIKESPSERRRFLDIALSGQSRSYLYGLSDYVKILNNRNALLKTQSIKYLDNTLPVWDLQLAKKGGEIIKKRCEFIKMLSPIVEDIYSNIAKNGEILNIAYDCDVELDNPENSILDALLEAREKDIRLGYTTVGPHRDDLAVRINDIDIRTFGSQGQQRTAALAIKLAEVKCIETQIKEKPVLILDDVLSELDPSRRENLLTIASSTQTLLTCTDFTENEAYIKNRIRLSK